MFYFCQGVNEGRILGFLAQREVKGKVNNLTISSDSQFVMGGAQTIREESDTEKTTFSMEVYGKPRDRMMAYRREKYNQTNQILKVYMAT